MHGLQGMREFEALLLLVNDIPLGTAQTTVDAGVVLQFGGWGLRLTGSNLGNRRDPVAESELGDAQYYRLPERSIWRGVDLRLD